MTGEPLGLPRGSVRAIITILSVLGCAVSAFVPTGSAAVGLAVIAGVAVRDYFAHRRVQNDEDGPTLDGPATF